jgi:phosphatidylserine decarboxylase
MKKWLIRLAIVLVVLFGAYQAFHQLYFLRLPDRNIPNDPTVFVSPADGLVYAVKEWDKDVEIVPKDLNGAIQVMTDGLGATRGTLVSITLNLHNIHYQRSMIAGKYLSSVYTKGEFHNALVHENDYGMRYENEHNTMLFESTKGTKYKIIQLAGFAARRIEDFMVAGGTKEVAQGDVIGVIKLGSQVTVIFPEGVEVIAKPGDRVYDGETVLAKEVQ